MKRLARESGSSRALDLVVLANRSHVVGLEDDPTSAAALVIATGFGRSRALSGQAPGQTGRVLCHERVFSRFTAALLAALDTDRDVSRPIPPVDERARAYAVRVRDLGIDEGATLLHPRSFDVSGPIVFTNVDPFSRVAGLSRPAPCVCLMRVSSDAAGAALAQSFDPPSTAELLSTSSEPEDDFEAR
jgi:acyl-CoA reductase-like NAD-dependent aldehyde dehydrogenase